MKQQKPTVLVLEDEQPLRTAIKSKLELGGFSVVTARAADQALDYLKDGVKVDAVWLDHYLYGKDSGLDFVAKLKKNQLWKQLPVFIVSNTVSPDKIESYVKLGISKCYTKVDYRLDTIVADIKKTLGGQKL